MIAIFTKWTINLKTGHLSSNVPCPHNQQKDAKTCQPTKS